MDIVTLQIWNHQLIHVSAKLHTCKSNSTINKAAVFTQKELILTMKSMVTYLRKAGRWYRSTTPLAPLAAPPLAPLAPLARGLLFPLWKWDQSYWTFQLKNCGISMFLTHQRSYLMSNSYLEALNSSLLWAPLPPFPPARDAGMSSILVVMGSEWDWAHIYSASMQTGKVNHRTSNDQNSNIQEYKKK